ncbi:hypothetical protein BDW62DRAFT_204654 [Aspergillus aurantiobrunneus]
MAPVPSGEPDPPAYRGRSYQLEMFEASLKDNIIVAMGTGSGKTHIALLRITHELENGDGNKLIWFLAPTVALCLQQHKAISLHIPAAKSRTLTGADGVDRWTEQSVWDAVLDGIQVVVSTPAVLLDAMTHGFIRISRLGLIIFDEAHHCTQNHPTNMIMRLFYHPALAKSGPNSVPRILGLTASAASNREELRTIEANLCSVCTTPQAHRHELLEHTHRPELRQVLYTPLLIDDASRWGGTCKALIEAYEMLDLENDPCVKNLRNKSPHGTALQKVLMTGKTYCSDQLKRFVSRVGIIFTELGPWAAEYFIWASTEQFRDRVYDTSLITDLDQEERKYLVDILSQLSAPNVNIHSTDPADFPVSPKFEALISFLLSADDQHFSGLIFVQQRATVAVMAHLLSVHPLTRNRFRVGGFIGMSNSTKKKDILGDLLTAKMQRDTLDDFRDGRKNLVIATDVLEEGIDVSACRVVVCYDKPRNLKSFVQRRGRARRQQSTYAMVLSSEDDISSIHKWQIMEKVMEQAYQQDRRRLEEMRALETINEDVCAQFCVESTGAILTADNAMQHLFHFCSTLLRQAFVDNKPEFSFERHDGGDLKGKVILPSSVIPAVRRAEGKSWWRTERAARKEAAFEAYKALYKHGLVNDNLLPLTTSREFTRKDISSLPGIQEVSEQYDPWVDWAHAWSAPNVHQSRIIVRKNGYQAYMKLIAPTAFPQLESMTLFWDNETTYAVDFEAPEPVFMTRGNVKSMQTITSTYLQATASLRLADKQDFITLFGPDLHPAELSGWLGKNQGVESALDVFSSQRSPDVMGVVRDHSRNGRLLRFNKWINGSEGLELECDSYPKRRNLLHPTYLSTKQPAGDELVEQPSKISIIPADQCTIDKLPATEMVFGRFIAVVLDRLEAALVATKLCGTILRDIHFDGLRHVITAITMPSAMAPTHYQRYEFFGDTVLKFTAAVSLYYKYPDWHEGYLTERLQAMVQNSSLARTALEHGLDSFIISKQFVPRKWSAPMISEKLDLSKTRREMATKVLADVVEALIGAAYIDGGHEKARACIRRFLPELGLEGAELDISVPQDQNDQPRLIQHGALEENIGYTFDNQTLLMEALTHPSCLHDTLTQSYQRLEFLGDAVLDMLIVDIILSHNSKISQGEMTRIKQATVSANLLAFLCMQFSWTVPQPSTPNILNTADPEPAPGRQLQQNQMPKPMNLYTYLRHSPSTPLFHNRDPTSTSTTLSRHAQLGNDILHALTTSPTYPWTLLSKLNPDKFFSDIIESIIGAIYVDSGGNLVACSEFIQRLGLVGYLGRILDEEIDVVHPIQKAQAGLQKLASKFWNGEQFKFQYKTVRIVRKGAKGSCIEHRTRSPLDADAEGDVDMISTEDTDADEAMHADESASHPGQTATYTCTIPVNGLGLGLDEVVSEGCLSKEDAECHAACLVVELLRQRGITFEKDDGDNPVDGSEGEEGQP